MISAARAYCRFHINRDGGTSSKRSELWGEDVIYISYPMISDTRVLYGRLLPRRQSDSSCVTKGPLRNFLARAARRPLYVDIIFLNVGLLSLLLPLHQREYWVRRHIRVPQQSFPSLQMGSGVSLLLQESFSFLALHGASRGCSSTARRCRVPVRG